MFNTFLIKPSFLWEYIKLEPQTTPLFLDFSGETDGSLMVEVRACVEGICWNNILHRDFPLHIEFSKESLFLKLINVLLKLSSKKPRLT
jgi:hypothetical protein